MRDKIEKLLTKFKLGKHYRMERFISLTLVLALLLTCVSILCALKSKNKSNESFIKTTKYTNTFITSKSNVQGKLVSVSVSDDKTKAFVLLHFADLSKISLDANNYQAFITAVTREGRPITMKASPSGSIYIFGNTGYMGIYLVDKSEFKSEILKLTIRGNAELVGDGQKFDVSDKSYLEFDQADVLFNLNGKDRTTLPCLNTASTPSTVDLYQQSVSRYVEQAVLNEIHAVEKELYYTQNKINEYGSRLKNIHNLQVPPLHVSIAGDQILRDNSGTPTDDSDDNYIFKPKHVLTGGFNFDYRASNINKGYIKQLISESKNPKQTPTEFIVGRVKERKLITHKDVLDTNVRWLFDDGSTLESLKTQGLEGKYKRILKDIDLYISTQKEYYKLKTKYSYDLLLKLLNIELTTVEAKSSISSNISDNCLINY